MRLQFPKWMRRGRSAQRISAEIARAVTGALEAQYLDKPTAEANALNLSAAADFVKSTADIEKVTVRVGSMLLVKALDAEGRPAVVVTELSREQRKWAENHVDRLVDPDELLRQLTDGCPDRPSGYSPPSALPDVDSDN